MDESHQEYVVPDLTQRMSRAGRALKRDLDKAAGFPVAVYPVVVVWGHFAATAQLDRDLAYLDGNALADWLAERPVDLRDERKRGAVRD